MVRAWFFQATIILIYYQFAAAAAMAIENVITIPAFAAGGQHGVIAQDRRLRRAGAKEGTPSSRKQKAVDC